MKRFISHIKIYAAAVAVVAIVLLAGCDKSEQPASENDNRTPLGVQIIDGGYTPTADERSDSKQPDTRASENGYKTVFTAADQVGLYTVKNGAVVTTCNNLCLTLTDTGGGNLAWTPPAGTTLMYEDASITYYAYYPYQTDMTGKVTPTATDAAGFFAPLENGWTPATDQSTQAKYTAQDLMTGSGTVSGTPGSTRTLTVGLTHRMALAVINIPANTTYALSTDADYTWQRTTSGLTFTGFTPYEKETDIYRYLVNPATAPTLEGSYDNTATGGTRTFSFTPAISASAYKTYTPMATAYTLAIGDFLTKDGGLISKDATLSTADKADCVGIVFFVGRHKRDTCNYTPTRIGKKDCHGHVMALTDVKEGTDVNGRIAWASSSSGAHQVRVRTSTSTYYLDGYPNRQKIKAFAATNSSGWTMADFPAANSCETYLPIAPDKSTGWHLPSFGQIQEASDQKEILTQSLSAGGWDTSIFTQDVGKEYWTSTEGTVADADSDTQAHLTGFKRPNQYRYDLKDKSYFARPFLAF